MHRQSDAFSLQRPDDRGHRTLVGDLPTEHGDAVRREGCDPVEPQPPDEPIDGLLGHARSELDQDFIRHIAPLVSGRHSAARATRDRRAAGRAAATTLVDRTGRRAAAGSDGAEHGSDGRDCGRNPDDDGNLGVTRLARVAIAVIAARYPATVAPRGAAALWGLAAGYADLRRFDSGIDGADGAWEACDSARSGRADDAAGAGRACDAGRGRDAACAGDAGRAGRARDAAGAATTAHHLAAEPAE